MNSFLIEGGTPLCGSIKIQGAKNSVLPILAGSLLCSGETVLHNCPDITDVDASVRILKCLGCSAEFSAGTLIVSSENFSCYTIPEKLMREMRSSIIFLGAMLAKCGRAVAYYPGGCELGPRPIDLHLKAFSKMGVKITENHGFINCSAQKLRGAKIHLDFPSVGATENIMLLATLAKGRTTIINCAKEPEIVDLQNFLNKMGANISGAGGGTIVIDGVKHLNPVEHTILPDRIVAATYLIAGAITKGDVTVQNVVPEHLSLMLSILEECGCDVSVSGTSVRVLQKERPRPVDYVRTMPYPGFPTDMQPQLLAYLSLSSGTSILTETVFESRFSHAEELLRMGADIKVDGHTAIIKGVPKLYGLAVRSMDLRGGAALALAGLAAEGETIVCDTSHIDRGYECFEGSLKSIGANIKRKIYNE